MRVATVQLIRWPPATLVVFTLTAPPTRTSTPLTPTSEALLTVASSPVKLVVPLLTVASASDAPVTEKPVAPVVTTVLRSADRAPPVPANRLAPLMVKERTLAPSMVPGVAPRPTIAVFPVTTLAVAMSSVRLLTTATTLPPMFSDALPLACSSWALVSVSAGIRPFGSLVALVATDQSMRGPPATLVAFSLMVPPTRTSTPLTPTSSALLTVASRPVKLVVPLLTVAILNVAPLTENPVAPAVTTELRSADSEAPVPTNRLAPFSENDRILAPLIVPASVPRPTIAGLPVTTVPVPMSICRPPAGINATTLPEPMLREPPAVIRRMAATELRGMDFGTGSSRPGSS